MAINSDNDDYVTIIVVIIGIMVVWDLIGKNCSGNKQQEQVTEQQINTQQTVQQINTQQKDAQSINDLFNDDNQAATQSNNTYPTKQIIVSRFTYCPPDDSSTGNENCEDSYNTRTYDTYPRYSDLKTHFAEEEYWKEWEHTHVKLYVELKGCESLKEAQKYDYSAIEEDGRYFVPCIIPYDHYEVIVIDKVNDFMWGIKESNLFLKFKNNPYLYKWDNGIVDTFTGIGDEYYECAFYKNPD